MKKILYPLIIPIYDRLTYNQLFHILLNYTLRLINFVNKN